MNSHTSKQNSPSSNRFQILSLDGGGIKGLFSAAILAHIESDLNIKITDHFDLIAGTSTGGIIAIALGLGLRPREIVEFYMREGPNIFPGRFGWLRHWYKRKYPQKPLEEALQRCFNRDGTQKRFGESNKRLVIPSYNLGEDDVYLFRTPHHNDLRRDYSVPAWQVARATGAAPTFFSCSRDINSIRLIDGGVWANNPTLVAVAEAHKTLRVPLSDLYIFSIGTTDSVINRDKRLDNGGIIAWGRGNTAVDVIMRGQSIGVNNQVKFLLGADHIERLDPKVSADQFSLDNVRSADDLIAKAAHLSRHFAPKYKEKFANHLAPSYDPLY